MISARHAGITPPKSLQRSLTVSILWVHLSVLTIALAAGFFVGGARPPRPPASRGHTALRGRRAESSRPTEPAGGVPVGADIIRPPDIAWT